MKTWKNIVVSGPGGGSSEAEENPPVRSESCPRPARIVEDADELCRKCGSEQNCPESALIMHNLKERIKELNCLYGMSTLVENRGNSLDEILQGIADLIPPSWQFPEVTCARISVEEKEHITAGFRETEWSQTADVFVDGKKIGFVQVCYIEEKPQAGEGPFLVEERSLIEAIAERIGNVVSIKRNEEAVLIRERMLSSLSQKVLTVLEEERERLARELHDSIGQQLVALRIELKSIKDQYVQKNVSQESFQRLVDITLNASDELKSICIDLRPALLDKIGFVAALKELVKEFGADNEINIRSSIMDIDESGIPPASTINTYRILQEAMTNIFRHSKAKNIEVSFGRDGGDYALEITDDGIGMPDEGSVQGFGIIGMKERTKIIGGRFHLESKPQKGTRLRVTFPAGKA